MVSNTFLNFELNYIHIFVLLGAPTNLAMFRQLGAELNWKNSKLYFLHPCNNSIKVFILLDPVHMLKLVRNQLESQGVIVCGDGKKPEWQHLVQLHELQTENCLRLGNRLTNAHVNFQNQKMKVSNE